MMSASVLAISTGLASASGRSTGGEAHVYEAHTNDEGNLGTVTLTGAITDHGTDDQNGRPERDQPLRSIERQPLGRYHRARNPAA
jgi:hypothetical protein